MPINDSAPVYVRRSIVIIIKSASTKSGPINQKKKLFDVRSLNLMIGNLTIGEKAIKPAGLGFSLD